MSANRESSACPGLWTVAALVVAVVLWLAVVALALDTAIDFTPLYGVPGLVTACVALVGFRSLCKSWTQGFFWSALLGFAVMFGLFIATFAVY